MLCREIMAVCSEIHTKHKYSCVGRTYTNLCLIKPIRPNRNYVTSITLSLQQLTACSTQAILVSFLYN